MSHLNESNPSPDEKQPASGSSVSTEKRSDIIKSVKSPLGFYTLVVLVVEAIMGTTVVALNGGDRTILIVGMISTIFLLVITVTILAFYGPEALVGKASVLEDINAYKELGNFYTDVKVDWEKALGYYMKAYKINSKDPSVLYEIGRVNYNIPNYEETIKYEKKTVEINPLDSNAWEFLGLAYNCLEKHDEALQSMKKAADINSNESRVWGNLGWVYLRKGDYKLAIVNFEKALKLDSKSTWVYEYMAQAHEKLGNKNQATKYRNLSKVAKTP
jgi:tetratricopeptide (TPR) repeat protein